MDPMVTIPTLAELMTAATPVGALFGGLILLGGAWALGKAGVNYVSGKVKRVAR